MPRIAVAGPSELVTGAAGLIADAGGSVVDTAIVAALSPRCALSLESVHQEVEGS